MEASREVNSEYMVIADTYKFAEYLVRSISTLGPAGECQTPNPMSTVEAVGGLDALNIQ